MQYVVCIYILWDVPRDMPCNIGTGHTVRICCRVRVTQGSSPMPHYIISRHRDFHIQVYSSFVPPSFKKIEHLFAIYLIIRTYILFVNCIKSPLTDIAKYYKIPNVSISYHKDLKSSVFMRFRGS